MSTEHSPIGSGLFGSFNSAEKVETSSEDICRSAPNRKLIDHMLFFKGILDGTIKLSNDRDANCLTSWKVGGQDFYAFGIEKEENA